MKIDDFLAKHLTVGKMKDGDIGYSLPWSLHADPKTEKYFLLPSHGVSEKNIGANTMVVVRVGGKFYVDISGSDSSTIRKITDYRAMFEPVETVFRDRHSFVAFLRGENTIYKRNMSTIDTYKWLEEISNGENCDGLCGSKENNFMDCKECWAGSILSDVWDTLSTAKFYHDNERITFSDPVKES